MSFGSDIAAGAAAQIVRLLVIVALVAAVLGGLVAFLLF